MDQQGRKSTILPISVHCNSCHTMMKKGTKVLKLKAYTIEKVHIFQFLCKDCKAVIKVGKLSGGGGYNVAGGTIKKEKEKPMYTLEDIVEDMPVKHVEKEETFDEKKVYSSAEIQKIFEDMKAVGPRKEAFLVNQLFSDKSSTSKASEENETCVKEVVFPKSKNITQKSPWSNLPISVKITPRAEPQDALNLLQVNQEADPQDSLNLLQMYHEEDNQDVLNLLQEYQEEEEE